MSNLREFYKVDEKIAEIRNLKKENTELKKRVKELVSFIPEMDRKFLTEKYPYENMDNRDFLSKPENQPKYIGDGK